MNQSLKAVVQLLLIIAAIWAILVWAVPQHPDATDWAMRFVMPLIAGLIIWLLLRDSRRPEILPDLLLQVAGRYFERDGFCFAFVPALKDGHLWATVFFQNRYSNPCVATVAILPPKKSFWVGRHPLPRIELEIPCDGAAFGIARIPWPVPAKYQGRKMKLEIGCNRHYPAGKGKLLRFREGLRCGSIGGASSGAAMTGALLVVGVIYISSPATVSVQLPTNVAEYPPLDAAQQIEILWRPDLPTNAFPVEPAQGPLPVLPIESAEQ